MGEDTKVETSNVNQIRLRRDKEAREEEITIEKKES